MADHLVVLDPGTLSTIQDFGRYGLQRFGISAAGALDPMAMRIANALVGNSPGEAVVEFTLSGGSLRVEADLCRIAVAGAEMPLAIDGAPAEPYRAHDLARGSILTIGFARTGMRAYLAVGGGFAIEPVLGSRSTHLRTGLGGIDGTPLRAGSVMPLRDPTPIGPPLILSADRRPDQAGPVRVVMGPQADAFTAEGIATFLGSPYTVTTKTDRMGCQLDGPAIAHRDGFNIVSDGIVNGSIQVPGHGRPIILLADRQTTGGYPKIATIVSADLAKIGQARIGQVIRFEAISAEAAERLAIAFAAQGDMIRDNLDLAGAGISTERLLAVNLIGGVVSAQPGPADETPDGSP
ncbi:biotin-dependent carboxyltransferase family protein [Microvirga antarctica]|uniref:5-oxoprolinase subunit C family protein n=1 Tax=Microvirga antarctica TaxID=2819233 RepID=UPI001B3031D1|nr:biotin-dependent carboxyltransferase family protein [Microvirga antarctica]